MGGQASIKGSLSHHGLSWLGENLMVTIGTINAPENPAHLLQSTNVLFDLHRGLGLVIT